MNDEIHSFANGLRVYRRHLIPPQIERYATGQNLHEPVEEGWFSRLVPGLPPASAFVDVGAAIGYYCFLVRRLNPSVALHAYEPDAENRARLLENAALNDVEGVCIHAEAVGRSEGSATLVGEGFTGYAGNRPAPGGRKVPMTTIDEIVRTTGRIGLLKMDIQGGEVDALNGALRALRARSVSNWVIGTHSAALHDGCLAIFRQHSHRILFESLDVEHQPDGLIVAATGRR